jgi:hypothetical protein
MVKAGHQLGERLLGRLVEVGGALVEDLSKTRLEKPVRGERWRSL